MSLVMTMPQRMGQVSLRVKGRGGQLRGTTFPSTASSTGVRDYIHVVDLAKGHIAALKKLKEQCGCRVGSQGGQGLESRANEGWMRHPIQHPLFFWADLQPGHRHRLFCPADGPSHGEGFGEEGRSHPPSTPSASGHLELEC